MNFGLVTMPYTLTPESAKLKGEIQQAIERHAAACAAVAADEEAIKKTPAKDWNSAHDTAAGKIRGRKITLSADEISIREQIGELYERISAVDHPAAVNAAIEAYNQSRAEATNALCSIGYTSDLVDGVENITEDMVGRHPRVKAARMTCDSLQGKRPWGDAQGINLQAINRLHEQTSKMKARGVALLA